MFISLRLLIKALALLANNSCHMNAVVILVDAEYIPNKYVHSDFKLNYSPTVNFGVGTFS